MSCTVTASCEEGYHSYSWPCDYAPGTGRLAELRAHECTDCDCSGFDWNCRSRALKTDPPSTCECGHEEARHRFRGATS